MQLLIDRQIIFKTNPSLKLEIDQWANIGTKMEYFGFIFLERFIRRWLKQSKHKFQKKCDPT